MKLKSDMVFITDRRYPVMTLDGTPVNITDGRLRIDDEYRNFELRKYHNLYVFGVYEEVIKMWRRQA